MRQPDVGKMFFSAGWRLLPGIGAWSPPYTLLSAWRREALSYVVYPVRRSPQQAERITGFRVARWGVPLCFRNAAKRQKNVLPA